MGEVHIKWANGFFSVVRLALAIFSDSRIVRGVLVRFSLIMREEVISSRRGDAEI